MTHIQFECPEELAAEQTPDALATLAQRAFLVRLYQLGRISSGRAAELLHVSRRAFLDILNEHAVSLFDEDTDVETEARRGR
jgi:predicted HTH domain antitoxin